jgi:nucleoside-diphosphate kinase
MVLEGYQAIALVRKLGGATKPLEATAGTIRGDYCQRVDYNIIHASDAPETAGKEIPIFFSEKELVAYPLPDERWI